MPVTYTVSGGGLDGEIVTTDGLGQKLLFRGRIYDQIVETFTPIRSFRHISDTTNHTVLHSRSLYGEVTAYLTPDGVFEYTWYQSYDYLVGTICRYGRDVHSATNTSKTKFVVDYNDKDGVFIVHLVQFK
jgi:hypothetical protein